MAAHDALGGDRQDSLGREGRWDVDPRLLDHLGRRIFRIDQVVYLSPVVSRDTVINGQWTQPG